MKKLVPILPSSYKSSFSPTKRGGGGRDDQTVVKPGAGAPIGTLPTQSKPADGGWYDDGRDLNPKPKKKLTWKELYQVKDAPDWWKGMIPSKDEGNTGYLALVNSLIPYMSSEDQRSVATSLYRQAPKIFKYDPGTEDMVSGVPTSITPDITSQYTSTQRAADALATLEKVKSLVKGKSSGTSGGIQYLRQILVAMKDYGHGAGESQTRSQGVKFAAAIQPLLAEKNNFASVGKMVSQPFFSAGNLVNVYKDQSGRYHFGNPNTSWF
jgi:hypothetical protein